MDKNFDSLALRLENKIYGTAKGEIRFQLLTEDILEFCPGFSSGKWKILDAGGGSGRFSRFCASYGHSVVHCDISREMLQMAEIENRKFHLESKIKLVLKDLSQLSVEDFGLFDLVLLHGVAEWMDHPAGAVRLCSKLVKPGSFASLLVYNTHKYLLKRGVNGRLHVTDKGGGKLRKLTPTGKMTPEEIIHALGETEGEVLLKSGIRIFNNFLKIIEPLPLSRDQWLEQERQYYRTEPFASLGEHSHILWKRNEAPSIKGREVLRDHQ